MPLLASAGAGSTNFSPRGSRFSKSLVSGYVRFAFDVTVDATERFLFCCRDLIFSVGIRGQMWKYGLHSLLPLVSAATFSFPLEPGTLVLHLSISSFVVH